MDEIFGRFPGLGNGISDQLDDQNLAKCRKVDETWKNFIDQEKTIWLRKIRKHVGNFNTSQDWQLAVSQIPTNTVKDLATAVCKFHESDPTRFDENWSPLHISVEQGKLNLSQYVIGKINDKNQRNNKGFTPLHFAAEKGNFELCRIIFINTEVKNPRTTLGITPHYLAAQKGHFEICQFFVTNTNEKNPNTNDGFTPLYMAAANGHFEICELTVKKC